LHQAGHRIEVAEEDDLQPSIASRAARVAVSPTASTASQRSGANSRANSGNRSKRPSDHFRPSAPSGAAPDQQVKQKCPAAKKADDGRDTCATRACSSIGSSRAPARPTRIELVINLKTAKSLRISLPMAMRLRR
jgi:hypothetical protein